MFYAHVRAFVFFKGACTRGIYDNMKIAVDAVFVGRERTYNRRFKQMCGHNADLDLDLALLLARRRSARHRLGEVMPRVRAESYEELNAWLTDRCVAHARARPRPVA